MIKYILSFLLLAILMINNCESAPRYQFLPPREGYVPVYIRFGDQPLEEIHPGLALAFHDHNIQSEDKIANLITANDDNELTTRLKRTIAKLNEEESQQSESDEQDGGTKDSIRLLSPSIENNKSDSNEDSNSNESSTISQKN